MKRLILFFLFLMPITIKAQEIEIDTMYVVNLSESFVTAERKWQNDTVRYRYNQMKLYVKKVLPYALKASKMFNEIEARLQQPGISKKEKKHYLSEKERIIREEFEANVKNFNTTQGVLLTKLIARQTGQNVYQMIDETKGTFAAIRFQT